MAFPSLRLGLSAPQPSKRHHAQSLLGPSLMTQRRIMFSNPTTSELRLSPAATMRDDILSAITLPLHCISLAACNPSPSCRFWVLDHLCSNLSQSIHCCWISETRSLNLCACFFLLLFCLCFSDRNRLLLSVPVCNLIVIAIAIPLLL